VSKWFAGGTAAFPNPFFRCGRRAHHDFRATVVVVTPAAVLWRLLAASRGAVAQSGTETPTDGTGTPTPTNETTTGDASGPSGGTPTPEDLSVVGETADSLWGLLPEWLAALPGARAAGALLVVLLGAYLSKFLVRLLARPVARRFERQSVAQTVLRGVRVGTVIFAGLVAADVYGLEIGNIVLSVTVFSAVLGIVLAPIVGSVLNGLFVLADQPYEIGDMIEFVDTGERGFVDDITLRYTKIFTLDNTFLVLPNSSIRERDVINYSAEDERTRLRLSVLVTYESDIAQARRIIERGAANVDDVIEGGPDIRIGSARYPAKPTAYIDEFADSGVLLTLRYWARRPYKLLTARSKVQTEIWELLQTEDVDVEMAYPHQHHVFDDTSGTAQVAVGQTDGPPRTNGGGPRGPQADRPRGGDDPTDASRD
jgi:small-conductance mechanosensitive channel